MYKKIRYGNLQNLNIFCILAGTLFVIYFNMLLYIVFFSRETGSRNGTDFGVFSTWGYTMQDHAWVIENVILFVPFGFLLSCLMKKRRFVVIILGCALSIAIEVSQLLTGRGFCQLDDVIMNTVGTVIGYVMVGAAVNH